MRIDYSSNRSSFSPFLPVECSLSAAERGHAASGPSPARVEGRKLIRTRADEPRQAQRRKRGDEKCLSPSPCALPRWGLRRLPRRQRRRFGRPPCPCPASRRLATGPSPAARKRSSESLRSNGEHATPRHAHTPHTSTHTHTHAHRRCDLLPLTCCCCHDITCDVVAVILFVGQREEATAGSSPMLIATAFQICPPNDRTKRRHRKHSAQNTEPTKRCTGK